MATISTLSLEQLVPATQTITPPARTQPAAELGQRFAQMMNQAVAAGNTPAAAGQAAQAPTAAGAPSAADASAEERARRALQLESPPVQDAKAAGGDTILDGLQKLRGVFDAQQARIAALTSQPVVNFGTLMAVQMEVVNFSLLVDVTSKLTGKSTQAFDTLLKGQ